ncbi:MAG: DUF3048 domain-containing protein [Candidatus Peribacteraceae bacterium]|nr:DUF3048 domain-containing protein [Candidatus Peribacteraceae bacterium]
MKFPVRPLSIAISIIAGAVLLAALLVIGLDVGGFTKTGPVRTASRARRQAEQDLPDIGSRMLSGLKLVPNWHRKELVAVMVENHETARPFQEGVDQALLVAEFPVEGLISRFALVFDRDDLPKRIGPVRSLRPYFIDALQPMAGAVIHAGGSPEAFARVEKGDIHAANLLFYYDDAERDDAVPEPHNLFVQSDKIEKLIPEDLPRVAWPPYAIGTPSTGSAALLVELNFYNYYHNVTYTYHRLSDSYIRSSGDVAEQGSPRNVLILETPITDIGEHGRLTIPLEGEGPVALFHSGKVQIGTWSKQGLYEPFVFQTDDGRPFLFDPGQTWMTAVPDMGRLKWE